MHTQQPESTPQLIPSFAFSPSTSSWVASPLSSNTNNHEREKGEEEKKIEMLRLATFNVLHDNNTALREYFIQSPKRNAHMIKLVCELNPDIICLNEVTVTILDKLLQNPQIRENYYVSDIPKTSTRTENMAIHEQCPFGNILLSKLPFLEAYTYQLSQRTCKRKIIFGVFEMNGVRFTVGGAHITAYENMAHIRKLQIDELIATVNRNVRNFGENVFLMGDFNFHHERENKHIEDQYLDLWLETHPSVPPSTVRSLGSLVSSYLPYSASLFPAVPLSDDENGYTYDSHTNSFIPYYVPFERRRMRLDRIIMKKGSNFVCASPMHRFATEPVEPNSYLFTSDHYGLYVNVSAKL